MLQFLKAFLDIVLWRRGPQDLPASRLLLWLTAAAYVAVSIRSSRCSRNRPRPGWSSSRSIRSCSRGVYLLLQLFGKTDRFLQTATAVLGTGVVLGLCMFLPLQWLLTQTAVPPESPRLAWSHSHGRDLRAGYRARPRAGDRLEPVHGVTLSLTYFLWSTCCSILRAA